MLIVHRGFSLIELIFTMALVGLVSLMAVLNMSSARGNANSRALATVVASELRLARQKAISSHEPVAVVIPTSGGGVPYSQSLYLATGQSKAHVSRVLNYASEHPQTIIFAGTWAASSPITMGQPAVGDRSADLNASLGNWLTPAMQKDYCFVFAPNGSVLSNNMPMYSGAYHMVVAVGGQFAAAGAPAGTAPVPTAKPNYFSTTALGKPWTIVLNQNGSVSVESGLVGQDGSVAVADSLPIATAPGAPPALANLPANNPVLQSCEVFSSATGTLVPVGADLSITAGTHCTLMVTATDDSGRDLYLQWTGDGGSFSFPGPERMTWDETKQVWTSKWEWSPPPDAAVDDLFNLKCSLGDVTAGLVEQPVDQVVQSVPQSTIVYAWNNAIWRMNEDGSAPIKIAARVHTQPLASISGDGSKVVYQLPAPSGFAGFAIIPSWGGPPLASLNPGGYGFAPSLSPRGDKVAYWKPGFQLCVSNLDGTGEQPVYNQPGGVGVLRPKWSPDQTQLSFCGTTAASPGGTLHIIDVAGTNHVVPFDGTYMTNSCWSTDPNDKWVYYGGIVLGKVRPDGTGATTVMAPPSGGPYAQDIAVSPDNSKIALIDQNSWLWIVNSNGTNRRRIRPGTSGYKYLSWGK